MHDVNPEMKAQREMPVVLNVAGGSPGVGGRQPRGELAHQAPHACLLAVPSRGAPTEE